MKTHVVLPSGLRDFGRDMEGRERLNERLLDGNLGLCCSVCLHGPFHLMSSFRQMELAPIRQEEANVPEVKEFTRNHSAPKAVRTPIIPCLPVTPDTCFLTCSSLEPVATKPRDTGTLTSGRLSMGEGDAPIPLQSQWTGLVALSVDNWFQVVA